jgi:hypothetical protein
MDVFDIGGKSIFEPTQKVKKKYILFLYSLDLDNKERIRQIERTIQKNAKDYILVRLEDADEGLKALMVKNIEIIVLDSSLFNSDKISVEYALECKHRKKCPVLFIAKDPKILIHEYRENMFRYEELDSYFTEPIDVGLFAKKLMQIANSQGRVAKRFSLNIPVRLFRLNTNQTIKVQLTDLSLVGFGLKIEQEDVFSKFEQVQIRLPLGMFKIFHPEFGEYLPLSGKLRRQSINGESLGFSLEFLTPMQIEVICLVLAAINYKAKLSKLSETPKEIKILRKVTSSDMM